MKWEERRPMKKDGVARLLQVFSEGIAREGVVEFAGHQTVLPEELEVEIEYKEKHGKSKFEIELKWRSEATSSTTAAVVSPETTLPIVKVATTDGLSPGKAINFAYPSPRDDAVLLVLPNGELRAYSTVCPHKGKCVTWDANSQKLYCPAHGAFFNPENGEKIEGPGGERLRKIHLKVKGGEVFAVGLVANDTKRSGFIAGVHQHEQLKPSIY